MVNASEVRLLTVKEAVDYLSSHGYRVSAGTVYLLVNNEQIKSRRLGVGRGTIRIKPSELDAYLIGSESKARPATPAPSVTVQRPAGKRKHLGRNRSQGGR